MAPKVGETADEKTGAPVIAPEVDPVVDGGERGKPNFTDVIAAAFSQRLPAVARAVDAQAVERVTGSGFELTGQDQPCVRQTETPEQRTRRLRDAAQAINEAANGGWLFGSGTDEDRLWDTISKLTPSEYKEVNEIYARTYGVKYAKKGETFDILKELEDELGKDDLDRFKRLIADKTTNEVPEEFRVHGSELLKEGCSLKVGQMNEITLPDGRRYDVYVPENADSRAPVLVAMHGAGMGDGKGLMAQESGLTIDAERTGSIVVFAYPKVRNFDLPVGSTDGIAWNVPGRTDLPDSETDDYDDRVYIDNVLADLGKRAQMADKVGMFGFSDGGRFAQVYAADRPDKVAGIVSIDGTWMKGDARPQKGVPIMIVHGTEDQTLPYNGGLGSTSRVMDFMLGSNLEKSEPFMQARVWSEANGSNGEVIASVRTGDVETRTYSTGDGNEVREYIVHGAEHGLHDYKNNGSRFIQWLMESPDRRHNFSLTGARFLKRHITG